MEFKIDEFESFVYAYRHAHGVAFAATGLQSSFGLFNPPFFIWLLSIPALFTTDPVLVTAFVAGVNVAGMLLLYAFLKRAFSADTALWTTALLSTAPWALLYSRKLWPQDVMIFFLVLFYWSLHSLMTRYRPSSVYLLFFSVAVLTQLHLIAWLIPLILIVFFDVFRVKIRRRDLVGGLLLFALLYAPYAFHQAQSSFGNLLDFLKESRGGLNSQDALEHLSWTVAATSGLKFSVQIGDEMYALFSSTYRLGIPTALFSAYAVGVVAGAAWLLQDALRKVRGWSHPSLLHPSDRILILLIAIWAVFTAVYILIGAPPFTQYHIIFYPLAPLLLVLGLQKFLHALRQTQSRIPSVIIHTFLLLVVLSNLYFSASFLHFLARNPEKIDAGYGKPYAVEQEEWERKIEIVTGEEE